MAVFGHSGSQAPQLMHSDVIIVAIAPAIAPGAAAFKRRAHAGRTAELALGDRKIWEATAKAVLTSRRSPLARTRLRPARPGAGGGFTASCRLQPRSERANPGSPESSFARPGRCSRPTSGWKGSRS